MSNSTQTIILIVIVLGITWLTVGEHSERDFNESLTKVGLKATETQQVEKTYRGTETGLSTMFIPVGAEPGDTYYESQTSFKPNYVGLAAYTLGLSAIVFLLGRKKLRHKTILIE